MTFRRVSGNARYPHVFHAARYKASPMSPLRGACYPSDLANSLVRRAHHLCGHRRQFDDVECRHSSRVSLLLPLFFSRLRPVGSFFESLQCPVFSVASAAPPRKLVVIQASMLVGTMLPKGSITPMGSTSRSLSRTLSGVKCLQRNRRREYALVILFHEKSLMYLATAELPY